MTRRATRTRRGVLIWANPPVDTTPLPTLDVDHGAAAADLRRVRGEWGVIAIGGPGLVEIVRRTARQIQQGTLAAYRPRGAFDAEVHLVAGRWRIYARYVGHLFGDTDQTNGDLRRPGRWRRR